MSEVDFEKLINDVVIASQEYAESINYEDGSVSSWAESKMRNGVDNIRAAIDALQAKVEKYEAALRALVTTHDQYIDMMDASDNAEEEYGNYYDKAFSAIVDLARNLPPVEEEAE